MCRTMVDIQSATADLKWIYDQRQTTRQCGNATDVWSTILCSKFTAQTLVSKESENWSTLNLYRATRMTVKHNLYIMRMSC